MQGYLEDPAATAGAFDGDGFYHSGDIGHIDAQGRLFVVDRIKELIKYKGYQVVPAELEAILLSHPAVADAAVIGLPAGTDGEIPKGFVVLASSAPLDEITSYLAERVAPYKKLRAIEAVTEIPRSATGKNPPAHPQRTSDRIEHRGRYRIDRGNAELAICTPGTA